MSALSASHGAKWYLLPSVWVNTLGAGAVTLAYFLAARLGLALLLAPSDVAVFWPASGIAAGILIILGRRARPALVIGVVIGTFAANLMSDRSPLTSLLKGVCNAGEAVLVAWLLEQWFDRPFQFGDLRRLAGFLVAACLATTASAIGGAATMTLLHSEAPYWDVWRAWFLSDCIGIVVVVPLMIELAQIWREPPSRREWIEGIGVLGLAALASFYTMSHKTASWLSFSPGVIVLPVLLWLTARCQPVFGMAGAFIASASVMLATTFGVGRFGDAAVPLMERVQGAQAAIITVTLYTLILVALFTQRKKTEEVLRESQGQLAKESAALARLHEVGTRLWYTRDFRQALDDILSGAITLLGADMGIIRILDPIKGMLKIEAHRGFTKEFLGSFCEVPASSESPCGRALRSGKRMVVADVEADTLFFPFLPLARLAGFRAVQSTPIMGRGGVLLGTLATHFHAMHQPTEQDFRLLDLYVRQAANIIERHKAEDALRESEERLRLAQLQTGIGVWDRDLRTGKLTWTPELEALFGLEPKTVKCYADFRERVHPEDIAAFEAARDAAVRERKTYSVEYRIISADGQVRWMLAAGGALYDEATGEPVRIIGNNADITERKVAEEKLQKSEQDFREILGGLPAAIYVTDAAGRITYCNESAVKLWGATPRLGDDRWCDLARFYHPDGKPMEFSDCPTDIALTQGRCVRGREAILERPDGTRIPIMPYPTPLRDGKGTIVGVVNMTVDIDERQKAERTLAELNAQLALAAKAALVGSHAGDPGHERMTISEGYAAIYGLPEGTTEMTRGEWRARVHPEDLPRLEEHRARTIGDKREVYNLDYRIVRADGEARWIEARGIVSYDSNGQPRRVIGINIDVTDRRQTEVLLNESKTRLSDALAAGHVVAFEWDAATGRSQRSDNADRIMGVVEGGGFLKQVYPEDRVKFQTLMRDLSPDNASYAFTFRFIRPDGRRVWLEETAKGEFDAIGRLVRIKGLTRDITERKDLEDHKNTLISELDHRVKNVLALVSTVASRTQETSSSMSEFVAALDGRIKSMAATHELLSNRRWQGIPLAELVRRELAPYATGNNLHIDGPEVVLSAEASQTVAMVFHELATNAAKFGAISKRSGRVSVRWSVRPNGRAEDKLCIDWEESGGPYVVPPTRWGFGTTVVRELIPYELGGAVDLIHLPEGVRCNLEISADWLSNLARL